MSTIIQSYDLCNLGVDSFRCCNRRPSLNYFPIFVNKEFLEIPLRDNVSGGYLTQVLDTHLDS